MDNFVMDNFVMVWLRFQNGLRDGVEERTRLARVSELVVSQIKKVMDSRNAAEEIL